MPLHIWAVPVWDRHLHMWIPSTSGHLKQPRLHLGRNSCYVTLRSCYVLQGTDTYFSKLTRLALPWEKQILSPQGLKVHPWSALSPSPLLLTTHAAFRRPLDAEDACLACSQVSSWLFGMLWVKLLTYSCAWITKWSNERHLLPSFCHKMGEILKLNPHVF